MGCVLLKAQRLEGQEENAPPPRRALLPSASSRCTQPWALRVSPHPPCVQPTLPLPGFSLTARVGWELSRCTDSGAKAGRLSGPGLVMTCCHSVWLVCGVLRASAQARQCLGSTGEPCSPSRSLLVLAPLLHSLACQPVAGTSDTRQLSPCKETAGPLERWIQQRCPLRHTGAHAGSLALPTLWPGHPPHPALYQPGLAE